MFWGETFRMSKQFHSRFTKVVRNEVYIKHNPKAAMSVLKNIVIYQYTDVVSCFVSETSLQIYQYRNRRTAGIEFRDAM